MIGRTFVALVLAAAVVAPTAQSMAEPLVTQGIGSSSCAKLAADLKPGEGLQNPVNLMLYAWVQGYLSAANVALLEQDGKHVDLGTLDESKVVGMVASYCKANPEHKPMAAVDDFIRKATKLRAKWDVGTVNWNG
ncbi:hypothetical protein [Rhodoplanes roseus]|uniref:Acid stress chaperone HdeA n=1 Tax=Rhodoplanes roseus TaxID=29409 RepID=A0A327KMW5_9BRAD|nr:hypothetical protein [Rhodoplanes roseus]RAI38662.1 hypothetical protein CH341_27430 [Rhodoplanes roseus]